MEPHTRGQNEKLFRLGKRKITSTHSMKSPVHYFAIKKKIIIFLFRVLHSLYFIKVDGDVFFFDNIKTERVIRNRARHNRRTTRALRVSRICKYT